MLGYDFSKWNTDEQWNRRSQSADFVIHKVSESLYKDPKGTARVKAMSVEKPCAVYHLIRPKQNKWEDEFNFFSSVIDDILKVRQVGIALDLESSEQYVPYNSPESIKIWIANLISALYQKYDRPVIVYMGDLYPDSWYEAFKSAGAVFWLARWVANSSTPVFDIPSKNPNKHDCHFWQFSSRWENENLDVDKAMKSDDEILRVLCFDQQAKPVKEDEPMTDTNTRVTDDQINAAVDIMALAVLDGKFGNAPERKENIYKAIQTKVNKMIKEGI